MGRNDWKPQDKAAVIEITENSIAAARAAVDAALRVFNAPTDENKAAAIEAAAKSDRAGHQADASCYLGHGPRNAEIYQLYGRGMYARDCAWAAAEAAFAISLPIVSERSMARVRKECADLIAKLDAGFIPAT